MDNFHVTFILWLNFADQAGKFISWATKQYHLGKILYFRNNKLEEAFSSCISVRKSMFIRSNAQYGKLLLVEYQ